MGLKEGIPGFWGALLDIIYPPKLGCAICNDREDRLGDYGICTSCEGRLPFIDPPTCIKCGKHIEKSIESPNSMCLDCKERDHAFYSGVSVFEFDPIVREVIHRYKYKGEKSLAEPMIHWMLKALEAKTWDFDGIVSVPLHTIRKRQRGFNQAELLARGISKGLGIPLIEDKLIRVKNTPQQAKLGREERLKNLKDAFLVEDSIGHKSILLVDDVFTTGTTTDQCTRALMEAGAYRVYVITLAIGLGY